MKSILVALIFTTSFLSARAHAEVVVPPCYDGSGQEARIVNFPTSMEAPSPAFATLYRGYPTIFINEELLGKMTFNYVGIQWVYFHECGHIVLGHIYRSEPGKEQQRELDADCYAALRLQKLNVSLADINSVLDSVSRFTASPSHPSGELRAKVVKACYEDARNQDRSSDRIFRQRYQSLTTF